MNLRKLIIIALLALPFGVVQADDVGAGDTSRCLYRVQVLP
jgi:hypothetical protein